MALQANLDLWRIQYEAIYGQHIRTGVYPADAMMALSYPPNWAGDKMPLTDTKAIEAKIQKLTASDRNIYFRVIPMQNRQYGQNERGGASDCLAIPCLFLDIDTADGVHKDFTGDQKGLPHPTREQALELVHKLMTPTLVVQTGGGLHVYARLDRPLTVPTEAEGKNAGKPDRKSWEWQLLQRWNDHFIATAHDMGVGVDKGVGADLARVLRVAGTYNHKRPPAAPVTILEHNPDAEVSVADLDASLTAANVLKARRTGASKGFTDSGKLQRKRDKMQWDFAKNVPLTYLLQELLRMQLWNSSDQWVWEEVSEPVSRHLKVVTSQNGEVEFAVVYDCIVQEALGVEDFETTITNYEIVLRCCGGDETLAATVIGAFTEPSDDLLRALSAIADERNPGFLPY